MRFEVTLDGQGHSVELRRRGEKWECSLEGRSRDLDVVEVAPGRFSVLLEGQSFELRVERVEGGYRIHGRGASLAAEVLPAGRRLSSRSGPGRAGPERVTAPMPGKVIRVLVREQQAVEAGQGLVVVEAMKMQNEIPAPKAGVVGEVRVREGERVNHGDVLVVVE